MEPWAIVLLIIGCLVVLFPSLCGIIVSIDDKVYKKKETERHDQLKKQLENIKNTKELFSLIRKLKSDDNYESDKRIIKEKAETANYLSLMDKANLYIELEYVSFNPESVISTVTDEKRKPYFTITKKMFQDIKCELERILEKAESNNDYETFFYIFLIFYCAYKLPYNSSFESSYSEYFIPDYFYFDDYQWYASKKGLDGQKELLRLTMEKLYTQTKCPILTDNEFESICGFLFKECRAHYKSPDYTFERNNDVVSDDNEEELEFEEQEINGHIIRFYPEPHKYTVDGKHVKTVTEVVKEWSQDNGFYEYYGVSQSVLRRAAKKGTDLHKEIELYEKYGEYGTTEEFYNYLKVKNYFDFQTCENELFVYICNEDGEPVCAGRLDFTLLLNGEFGLCDIKRTSKYHKEEVELQLNLYRLGYEQLYGEEIKFLRCLRLRKDIKEFIPVKLNKALAKKAIKNYCC